MAPPTPARRPARPRPGGRGAPARRSSAPSSEVGTYVYAVRRAHPALRLDEVGIGGAPCSVYELREGELSAVAADLPATARTPTRENLFTHHRVNEAAARSGPSLPMSFGSLFRSRQDVRAMLRDAHDAFVGALDQVDGRLELGLEVIGPEAAAGLAQEESLEVELQSLEALAAETRASSTQDDRVLLQAAFLIPRELERRFRARVRSIARRHPLLELRCTGPWPPYSFVNLRLRLDPGSQAP